MIGQPSITQAQIQQWAQTLIAGMRRDFEKEMKRFGGKMVAQAQARHRFKNKTGKANASIQSKTEIVGTALTMTFHIDPVGVQLPTGYNKTWILNDGTYGKYRRGKISPTAQTVGGAPNTGIDHDDFMGDAWEQLFPQLDQKLTNIFRRVT